MVRRFMKDGAIYYQRLNNPSEAVLEYFGEAGNSYWKDYYQQGLTDFHNLSASVKDNNFKTVSIGDYLINLGKIELNNELHWLSQTFGFNDYDAHYVLEHYNDFIKIINQLSGMGNNFSNIVKELELKAEGKNRAGVATAYFDSHLSTVLGQRLAKFPNPINMSKDEIDAKFEQIIKDSIMEVIHKISITTDTIDGEDVQSWKELEPAMKLLQTNTTAWGEFENIIMRSFHLDEVKDAIVNWKTNKALNKKNDKTLKQTVRTTISKGKDTEIANRSIMGFLDEYFSNAIINYTIDVINGGMVKTSGRVLTGNIATTDTITFYSREATIDLSELSETLNDAMNTNSKKAVNKKLQQWLLKYQNILNNNNIFLEYSNNKLQGLGDYFDEVQGFSNGGKKLLIDAPSIINRADNGNILPITAIYKLFNTADGAMFEGEREYIELNIKLALSSAIASMLFDDWQTIGIPNTNAVHVFTLDYIKIPLSFLLIKLGEAVKVAASNINNYVRIDFQLAHPDYTKTKTPATTKNEVLEYWDKQAALMKAQSTFSVYFLQALKDMLGQLK